MLRQKGDPKNCWCRSGWGWGEEEEERGRRGGRGVVGGWVGGQADG